jgi:uncharacterized protein YegP (UPF0339 family)
MARVEIRSTVDGSYRWLLLSDNNRTLATSATVFVDRDACAEHVQLTVRVAQSQAPLVQQRGGGRWVWVLTDEGGTEIAHSVAQYTRRTECFNAINRFAAALGAAR